MINLHELLSEMSSIFRVMSKKDDWEKKREVAHSYDAAADIYDLRYEEEQRAKYKVILRRLKLDPSDLLLDVGCGTGLFLQAVANSSTIVVGVDISVRMLRAAKRRCNGIRKVSLILGDADYLPLRRSLFDKAYAITLLQNLPDPEKTVRELMSVIKPRGKIALTSLKRTLEIDKLEKLLALHTPQSADIIDVDDLKDYIVLT